MAVELAKLRISEAQEYLEKIKDFESTSIRGACKLRKRVQGEIRFLEKSIKLESGPKEGHIKSSNLTRLGALLSVAGSYPQVTGILQKFLIGGVEKIEVDIVGENGRHWIKVISRNPKSLHFQFRMGSRKGMKPLDEVASDFLICADQHPVLYSPPKIIFWFTSGVSQSLADALENQEIVVKGTRIPDDEMGCPEFSESDSDSEFEESDNEFDSHMAVDDTDKEREFISEETLDQNNWERASKCNSFDAEKSQESIADISTQDYKHQNDLNSKTEREITSTCNTLHECQSRCSVPLNSQPLLQCTNTSTETLCRVNLDVTAMIAYVSATSNGGSNFTFKDKILNDQAIWERQNPVKNVLDSFFEGRLLLACQEAVDHFMGIINTIGGPGEQTRAQELLARLTIVPGEDLYKDQLKIGGKVRKLSRTVFGTGEAYRAYTVTSNVGFIRSVQNQGVKPVVLCHSARALTERKENSAIPLDDSH